MTSVVNFIRRQRIQWLGHDIKRALLEWNPRRKNLKRNMSRTVEDDLNRTGIQEWARISNPPKIWLYIKIKYKQDIIFRMTQ